MKTLFTFIAVSMMFLASCEKYNYINPEIGGDQSPIGEVGNTFSVSQVDGLSGVSAKITELNDGISKIQYLCQIDNPKYLEMAKYIPGTTINGKNIEAGGEVKITTKGMMNVYPEGKLLLVDYDGKVGDKYSLKRGANTIERELVRKSTDDDYFWGWMMIKTVDVEETGRGIPGVSKVQYFTNHKFGLVGVRVHFEDGTFKNVSLSSSNSN